MTWCLRTIYQPKPNRGILMADQQPPAGAKPAPLPAAPAPVVSPPAPAVAPPPKPSNPIPPKDDSQAGIRKTEFKKLKEQVAELETQRKKLEKEVKVLSKSKKDLDVTKESRKLLLKESVTIGEFIAFIAGIYFLMISGKMIVWWDIQDVGFKLFCWIALWGVFLILGFQKPSVMSIGINILKILFDPRMTNDSKLAFIKAEIEKLVGIAIMLKQEEQSIEDAAKETK